MNNSPAEIIRQGYRSFAEGDIPAVLQILDPDITWHVPGRSPLSGDYHGPDGVLKFFGLCMDLSGGTLRVEADEILADGERVVVLSTVSAQRLGRSWSGPEVHVWRLRGQRALEFREFQGDQDAEDEFWNA